MGYRWGQGGSDGLYDFCQLNDGKIAFVGNKAFSQDGGLWVFVTDSTGKKIVWEKKYNLPGVDEKGFLLNTITPLSLCSTPDGGFTVVGTNNTYGGNYNACAFHFVPKPVETATKQTILLKKSEKVRALQTGNNVVFKFVNTPAASHELIVYNAAGRIVVRLISVNKASTSIVWDCSGAGKGPYLYKVKLSDGSFVYGRFSI